jgi:hypothetical protein
LTEIPLDRFEKAGVYSDKLFGAGEVKLEKPFSHLVGQGGGLMNFRHHKLSAAVALLAILAIGQMYVGTSFAVAASASTASMAGTPQLMGVLTTSSNKPITVNGAPAQSGASIPSGATIETPAGVGATVKLGNLGTLCLAPGTKLTLEFDQQGNVVNVTLIDGCAVLDPLQNVTATIKSAQATLGTTTGGSIDVCMKAGAAPAVNQGAAVDAGAGASALDCGGAGAAAVPGGIPPAATAAFIGGGVLGLYLLFRGGDPSPSGL